MVSWLWNQSRQPMRKLIAFDDDTADKLVQLGRERMATWQDLADEAFADLLRKHGVPIDLKDALKKSARQKSTPTKSSKGSTRRKSAAAHQGANHT